MHQLESRWSMKKSRDISIMQEWISSFKKRIKIKSVLECAFLIKIIVKHCDAEIVSAQLIIQIVCPHSIAMKKIQWPNFLWFFIGYLVITELTVDIKKSVLIKPHFLRSDFLAISTTFRIFWAIFCNLTPLKNKQDVIWPFEEYHMTQILFSNIFSWKSLK